MARQAVLVGPEVLDFNDTLTHQAELRGIDVDETTVLPVATVTPDPVFAWGWRNLPEPPKRRREPEEQPRKPKRKHVPQPVSDPTAGLTQLQEIIVPSAPALDETEFFKASLGFDRGSILAAEQERDEEQAILIALSILH